MGVLWEGKTTPRKRGRKQGVFFFVVCAFVLADTCGFIEYLAWWLIIGSWTRVCKLD